MRLPDSAQEIADVIGRDQALYLIGQLPTCYAGTNGRKSWRPMLYVPKSIKPDHPLVRIIGWKDAQKLVDEFGGMILYPANCSEIYRAFRDQSIVQLAIQGIDRKEIAEIMGVTDRHVRSVLRRENPQEAKTAANDNTAPVSIKRSVTA